jgi:hypothetical protein
LHGRTTIAGSYFATFDTVRLRPVEQAVASTAMSPGPSSQGATTLGHPAAFGSLMSRACADVVGVLLRSGRADHIG